MSVVLVTGGIGELGALVVQRLVASGDHIGGPHVILMEDLARTWLTKTGQRRAVLPVPVPVPGKLGQALRAGANLCPVQAVGVRTAEQRSTPPGADRRPQADGEGTVGDPSPPLPPTIRDRRKP